MTPYKTDLIDIGRVYAKPLQKIDFTEDEEFIQDLLLNNKKSHLLELVITICYLTIFFAVVAAIILRD